MILESSLTRFVACRAPPVITYRRVSLGLGLILCAAGALKAFQLFTSSEVLELPFYGPSRVGSLILAATEIQFGLWLCLFYFPQQTRWAAIGVFSILLAVSLRAAVDGKASCACFGPIQTMPWVVAFFDLVAVLLLVFTAFAGTGVEKPRTLSQAPGPVFLLLACPFLCVPIAFAAAASQTADAHVKAEPETILIGAVVKGTLVELPVKLTNHGQELVHLASWESSCPCLTLELNERVLVPDQSTFARIRLELGHRPEFVGHLAVEIRGMTHEGGPAFLVKIEATVVERQP